MLFVLPSDIARLILDYAERMSWDRTAAQMLKEVPELKEIAQMRRQHGKQVRTLRWQQSLDGALSDYMAAKETVTAACESYPYIFENVPTQDTLAKQVEYMVKRVTTYTKLLEATSVSSSSQSQNRRSKVQNMILRTEQNVPKQKEVYVRYSQEMGFEHPISETNEEQSGKDTDHCDIETAPEIASPSHPSQNNLLIASCSVPKTSKLSPKRKCLNVRKRTAADCKQYQEQLLHNVFNNTDFPERLADCINKTLANKNYTSDEAANINQSELKLPDKMYGTNLDADCNTVSATNKMPHSVVTETVNKILDDPISVCLFDELGIAPMHSKTALPIPSPPNRMLNTPIPQHDLTLTQNDNDVFDYHTESFLTSPPHPNVLPTKNSEPPNTLADGYQYSNSHVRESNPSLLKSSEPMNSFQSYASTSTAGMSNSSVNGAVMSDCDGVLHHNSPSAPPAEPSYSSADAMQLPSAALQSKMQVSRSSMNCSLPILPTANVSTSLPTENTSTTVSAVESSPRLPIISMSIPGFDNTKDKMKELAQKNNQPATPHTSTKIILINRNYTRPVDSTVVKKPLIPKSISCETLTRPMTVTLPNRIEVKVKEPITAASFNAVQRKKKKEEEQKRKESILSSHNVSETRNETQDTESLTSTDSDVNNLVMMELPPEAAMAQPTELKEINKGSQTKEIETDVSAVSTRRKKKQNANKSHSPGVVAKTLELFENPSTRRKTTRSQSAMKTSVPGKQLLSTTNTRGSQSTPSYKKKSHIRVLEFETPPKSGFRRFNSRSPKRASTRSLFSGPIDKKKGNKNVNLKDKNPLKRKLNTILEISHDNVDGDSNEVIREPLPKKMKRDGVIVQSVPAIVIDEGVGENAVIQSNDEFGAEQLINPNEDLTTTFCSLKTPCKFSSLSLEAQTPFAGAAASTSKSIGTVSKYDLNTPLLPPIQPLVSPIKTPNFKSSRNKTSKEQTFTQDENSVSSIVNNAGLDLFDEASLDVGTFNDSKNSSSKKKTNLSKSNSEHSDTSSEKMSPSSLGIALEKAIEEVCGNSIDSTKFSLNKDKAKVNENAFPENIEETGNSNDLVIPLSNYDNMHVNQTVNINLPEFTQSTTQLLDIVDHLESANIVDGSFFSTNKLDANLSLEKTKKSKQNSAKQFDGDHNGSPKISNSKDVNNTAASIQNLFGSDFDSDSDFLTPIKTNNNTPYKSKSLTPKSKSLTPKSKSLTPKSMSLTVTSKNKTPKSKSQTPSNTKTPSKTEAQSSSKVQDLSPAIAKNPTPIKNRNSLKNVKSHSKKYTKYKNKSKSGKKKHSTRDVHVRRSSRIAQTSPDSEKLDPDCKLKEVLEANVNTNPEVEANIPSRTPKKNLKQKSPAKSQNFWMNWTKRFTADEEDLNESLPDIAITGTKFDENRRQSPIKSGSPKPSKSNCEEGSLSQSYIELESQLARLDGTYDGTGVPDTPGKSLSVFAYLPKTPEKELASICRYIVKDNPKAMAVVPSCNDISNNCNTDYSHLSHAALCNSTALSKSSQLYSGQTINDLLLTSPIKCDSNAIDRAEESINSHLPQEKAKNPLTTNSLADKEDIEESAEEDLFVVEDEVEVNLFLSELVVLTQMNIVNEPDVFSYPPESSCDDEILQDFEKLSSTEESHENALVADMSVCEDADDPNKIQIENKPEKINKVSPNKRSKASTDISLDKVNKAPKKKSKKGSVKRESKSKRSNLKASDSKSEGTIDPVVFSEFRDKIMAENRSKARMTDASDEDLPLSVMLKKKKKDSRKGKGKNKAKPVTDIQRVNDSLRDETKARKTDNQHGVGITSNDEPAKVAACDEVAEISTLDQSAEISTHDQSAEISTHDQSAEISTHEQSAEISTHEQSAEISTHEQSAEISTHDQSAEISTHDQSADKNTILQNVPPESCDKLLPFPRHPKFLFTDTMCSDAATPSHLKTLPTTSTPLLESMSGNGISSNHPNILGSGSYFPEEPKTPEKYEVTNSFEGKKTKVAAVRPDEATCSRGEASEGVLGNQVTRGEESLSITGEGLGKRKLDAENNENTIPSKKNNSLLRNKSRFALMKTIHKIYQKK